MIEREAINIKDMTKVLNIDASGQKGHWVKVIDTADKRQCNICKAILAWNNPYTNFCSNCGADMRKEIKKNETD